MMLLLTFLPWIQLDQHDLISNGDNFLYIDGSRPRMTSYNFCHRLWTSRIQAIGVTNLGSNSSNTDANFMAKKPLKILVKTIAAESKNKSYKVLQCTVQMYKIRFFVRSTILSGHEKNLSQNSINKKIRFKWKCGKNLWKSVS